MSDAKKSQIVSSEGCRGEKSLPENNQHFPEQFSRVSQFKQIPKNYVHSDQDSIINPSKINSQNENNVFPKTDCRSFAHPKKQSNQAYSVINYAHVNHTSNNYLNCNGIYTRNFGRPNCKNQSWLVGSKTDFEPKKSL